jgi:hypothetical protein
MKTKTKKKGYDQYTTADGSLASNQMLYPPVLAQLLPSIHTVQPQDSLSFTTSTISDIDPEDFTYIQSLLLLVFSR